MPRVHRLAACLTLLQGVAATASSCDAVGCTSATLNRSEDEFSLFQHYAQVRAFQDRAALRPSEQASPRTGNATVDGEACSKHADCCSSNATGCSYYCRQSSQEIKGFNSTSGWWVPGVCAAKWPGFCLEDEDCTITTHFCERPSAEDNRGAGVCRWDSFCSQMPCKHGSCRAGVCTCFFGFQGPLCSESHQAFAFLFYGDHPRYLASARVLVKSIRAHGTENDIVAIVPKDDSKTTTLESTLDVLRGDGVLVNRVEFVSMPAAMSADPIIRERWAGVMTKFQALNLINYVQVALLDIDIVFNPNGWNPLKIFEACAVDLCAVQDNDKRFLNAGVMVFKTSDRRFQHLLMALHQERHHYDMPEQSFLTEYAKNPNNRFSLAWLDSEWNSCVRGGLMVNQGRADPGVNAIHSCSWCHKPEEIRICTPEFCDEEKQRYTVLIWQDLHKHVDPCILHSRQPLCEDFGDHVCRWCGHYCSDARVSCSDSLFKYDVVDTVDPLVAEQAETDLLLKSGQLSNSSEALEALLNGTKPAEVPQAAWAWPQVAIYQAMVDRFASVNEEDCEVLDDYCGGTFEAMKKKLPYLKELGVDGLLLSPVVANMPKGYHGYWPQDLNTVNPYFGTQPQLEDLILSAQDKGMRVTADLNLNHAGSPMLSESKKLMSDMAARLKPFNDLKYFHEDNCSLFVGPDFERGPRNLENCKLFGMLDYRQEDPVVQEALLKWVEWHISTLGFNSIRVDAARHMHKRFLADLGSSRLPIPAFHEDPNNKLSVSVSYALNHGPLGAVYNYPLYYKMRDVFQPGAWGSPRKPMIGLADAMNPANSDGRLLLNFLDNNDLPRFARLCGGSRALYHSALTALLGSPGVPILLYGSEQAAQSRLTIYSGYEEVMAKELAHKWRPPLWSIGYDTKSSTFMLLRKLLWVRKRLNGMHELDFRMLLQDREWLVFSRGPVLFVVTNMGKDAHHRSQRVLWVNSTQKQALLCNFLADGNDCILQRPGKPHKLELRRGVPKVYLPRHLIYEFLDAHPAGGESLTHPAGSASLEPGSVPVIAVNDLRPEGSFPGLVVHTRALPRVPLSVLPSEGLVHPAVPLHTLSEHDTHLASQWYPPLWDVPALHGVAHAEHACYLEGALPSSATTFKGWLVQDKQQNSGLVCGYSCSEATSLPSRLSALGLDATFLSNEVAHAQTPVLHADFDHVWSGFYHILTEALPNIAWFWPEIQAGQMHIFFSTPNVESFVGQVLQRLHISPDNLVHVNRGESQTLLQFCAPKVSFVFGRTGSTHPSMWQIPRLRTELSLPCGPGPRPAHYRCGPREMARRGVVLVSRGNGARGISNEEELLDGLRSLHVETQVVYPNSTNLNEVVDVFAGAKVLVGVHGANLVNMIYAPPETAVVEIMPRVQCLFVNEHYRVLAGFLGFHHSLVEHVVQPDEITTPCSDAMCCVNSIGSLRVDVDRIKAHIRGLMSKAWNPEGVLLAAEIKR